MCQFSVKTDNFDFFGKNMGKFRNYMRFFGSKNVEVVADICMEAEMRWWRWMELPGGRCSWVEVADAGWNWVCCLAIPMI